MSSFLPEDKVRGEERDSLPGTSRWRVQRLWKRKNCLYKGYQRECPQLREERGRVNQYPCDRSPVSRINRPYSSRSSKAPSVPQRDVPVQVTVEIRTSIFRDLSFKTLVLLDVVPGHAVVVRSTATVGILHASTSLHPTPSIPARCQLAWRQAGV